MADYTRGELQDKIQEWANESVAYRNALMKTPKKVFEQHIGKELPEDFEVEVVQDSPTKMYIALGAFPGAQGEELDDDDLENVAGGFIGGLGGAIAGGLGGIVGDIFGGGGGGGGGGTAPVNCNVSDVGGDAAMISNVTVSVEGNMTV